MFFQKVALRTAEDAEMGKNNKPVSEIEDSDQSISEDSEGDVPGDCISLCGTTDKKGRGQVLSQLEKLRDAHEFEHFTRPSNTFQKDEVEIPVFEDKGNLIRHTNIVSACSSDDESISDDEVIKENNMLVVRSMSSEHRNYQDINFPVPGIARNDDECAWSAVNREVEELVHINENAACSSSQTVFSRMSKSLKGVRGKAKPKFSFNLQSHKNIVSKTCMPSNALTMLEEPQSAKHIAKEHSMSGVLEFFERGKIEQSDTHEVQDEVTFGEDHTKYSMAELLDSFQEDNGLLPGDSEVISRTKERSQLVIKRNIHSLGDRTLDGDKSPDVLDSDSSSDDQVVYQNLELIIPESKRIKTLADQFQELIGAASVRDQEIPFALPTHMSTGLFGKLQHVIQSEKERDMDFMKKLQAQASLEGSYFDVKILSRWLEAKLIVCCCMFIQHQENSQMVDSCQMERKAERSSTVMFTSRSCGDIELEVGNLIRIHYPWYVTYPSYAVPD